MNSLFERDSRRRNGGPIWFMCINTRNNPQPRRLIFEPRGLRVFTVPPELCVSVEIEIIVCVCVCVNS